MITFRKTPPGDNNAREEQSSQNVLLLPSGLVQKYIQLNTLPVVASSEGPIVYRLYGSTCERITHAKCFRKRIPNSASHSPSPFTETPIPYHLRVLRPS